MSDANSPLFLSRQSQVSVCLEGSNAILFDPDTGQEKVINHSGLTVWNAMDGTAQPEALAAALARTYEIPLSEEVQTDARVFMGELLRDGYAAATNSPSPSPAAADEYSWIEDAPRDFDLSLTGRCNLKCAYCFYADEMVGRHDLPTQTWLSFFEELKSLAVRNLTLSGGEIFVRNDLWTLIDGIIASRMRYGILTNGTLITEKTIEQLLQPARRRRLNSIQVSIDGSCAAVHDRSRGKGSFDQALRGLRLLKEAGLPVTVRLTVNRYNVEDLENAARLLLDDVGLPSFSTNDAMPMGTGCTRQEDIVITTEQRIPAMMTLARMEQAYSGRITASAGSLALYHMFRDIETAKATGTMSFRWPMGTLTSCGCMNLKLAVHHDGMIVPCNMLAAASLGTILKYPIHDIWRSHPLLLELRHRKNLPMTEVAGCEGCEWTDFCSGGCPAVPFTQTGNLYLPNQESCYRKFIAETGGLPRMKDEG